MFAINITCLGCCPIVISNSEYRQVSDDFAQSGSDAFVTGSLVYAENQFNPMQKFEGKASEGLFNQGREMAGVSKFVNIVELEQPKTSMGERSNSSIPKDNINLCSPGFIPFNSTGYYTIRDERNDNKMNQENGSEYLGSESPPSPRKQDSIYPISVAGSLQLNMSQGNPEGKRSESPPPPPPPRNSKGGSQVPPFPSLLPLPVRSSDSLSPGNDSPLGDCITVDLDARLNDSLRNLEGGRPDSPPPPPRNKNSGNSPQVSEDLKINIPQGDPGEDLPDSPPPPPRNIMPPSKSTGSSDIEEPERRFMEIENDLSSKIFSDIKEEEMNKPKTQEEINKEHLTGSAPGFMPANLDVKNGGGVVYATISEVLPSISPSYPNAKINDSTNKINDSRNQIWT